MKLTMTIFVCVLAAGVAAGQSPITVIQNTRTTMNGVQSNSAAASNAALGIQDKAPSAAATHASPKPSAAPAVSVKPAAKKPNTAAATTKVPAKTGAKAVKPVKASTGKTPAAKAAKKSVQAKAAEPAPKTNTPAATTAASGASPSAAADGTASDDSASKWNASGKRDPFISPVVSRAASTSCSSGKKCLEIGTISLRGIVHAESGFIAVVSNGLNKAYFLRENDPVFNGYVMKITGDSITFQETLQDRLGKTFTREVVKKITTPAV